MRHLALVLAGSLAAHSVGAQPITFTKFDLNHSTVGFAVPILGEFSEVHGKFKSFAATLVYEPSDITKSSIEATIDASSIDTGIDERDTHLRSSDFFDVAKHPEIRFRSAAIVVRGGQLIAVGTLSMRGVEKQIELPFVVKGLDVDAASGKVTIGISADMTLNRQDYGISWRHDFPTFVGDEIVVRIRLISRLTSREPAAPASP
jgi:polyisoprenoid-binding protein YceI